MPTETDYDSIKETYKQAMESKLNPTTASKSLEEVRKLSKILKLIYHK